MFNSSQARDTSGTGPEKFQTDDVALLRSVFLVGWLLHATTNQGTAKVDVCVGFWSRYKVSFVIANMPALLSYTVKS